MLETFPDMNLCTRRVKMDEIEKHKIKLKFMYEHKWIDHPLSIQLLIDDRPIHIDMGSGVRDVTVDKKVAISAGEHTMKLKIDRKNEANVRVNSLNEVIDDSLVTIKDCIIDDISLMTIITAESKFYNDQTAEPLEKVTELGYNGTWELKFKVPTYDWLLEKLF